MSKFAVNFEDNELLNALRLLKEQKYFTDRKIATLSGHKSGQSVYYWRRSKSQPSPEERWRIIQAAKLTDAITRRVSAEYVPLFFAHPFELLGGKTPLQVLPADTHKDVLDETVQCFAELVQGRRAAEKAKPAERMVSAYSLSVRLGDAAKAVDALMEMGFSLVQIGTLVGQPDGWSIRAIHNRQISSLSQQTVDQLELARNAAADLIKRYSSNKMLELFYSRNAYNGLHWRSIADLIVAWHPVKTPLHVNRAVKMLLRIPKDPHIMAEEPFTDRAAG